METVRSEGFNESERYLSRLADRTFLNLWSWPNVFRDVIVNGKRSGKEICDLLVVCGDTVIIFSVKHSTWRESKPVEVAWASWYRNAVGKAVDQLRGAERWLSQHPGRVFLDAACQKPFPLTIPPWNQVNVHLVAVALGADEPCKDFFGAPRGSFLVRPEIRDGAHGDHNHADFFPFTIGDVNASGRFVHVMNGATLDILMEELDTIHDLTSYFDKKSVFLRSGKLGMSSGDEDLMAYYLKRVVDGGKSHGFPHPEDRDFEANEIIVIDGGYDNFLEHPQYKAKKEADHDSYIWDSLITAFTDKMLAGTTLTHEDRPFVLAEHERAVGYMAREPRFHRRMLGNRIMSVLQKSLHHDKSFGASIPSPGKGGTAYVFLTLKHPDKELPGGYDQYRRVRTNMLQTYCMSMLERYRHIERVIGVAFEPMPTPETRHKGSSEDLIYAEQCDWTDEMIRDLELDRKDFGIMQTGVYREGYMHGTEYP